MHHKDTKSLYVDFIEKLRNSNTIVPISSVLPAGVHDLITDYNNKINFICSLYFTM